MLWQLSLSMMNYAIKSINDKEFQMTKLIKTNYNITLLFNKMTYDLHDDLHLQLY